MAARARSAVQRFVLAVTGTSLLLFATVVAAEYTYLRTLPVSRIVEYRWAEQVGPIPRDRSRIVMQSGVVIHKRARIEYDIAMRCRPNAGGRERTFSKTEAVFSYDAPRALALSDDASLSTGYEHVDGEWDYRGGRTGLNLPNAASTCRLTITPCALLEYGIRRCQRAVRSGPIVVPGKDE